MKEVKATRALKEQAYRHFLKGGNAAALPDILKRLPIPVLQDCQMRAFEKKVQNKMVKDIKAGGSLSKAITNTFRHD